MCNTHKAAISQLRSPSLSLLLFSPQDVLVTRLRKAAGDDGVDVSGVRDGVERGTASEATVIWRDSEAVMEDAALKA